MARFWGRHKDEKELLDNIRKNVKKLEYAELDEIKFPCEYTSRMASLFLHELLEDAELGLRLLVMITDQKK